LGCCRVKFLQLLQKRNNTGPLYPLHTICVAGSILAGESLLIISNHLEHVVSLYLVSRGDCGYVVLGTISFFCVLRSIFSFPWSVMSPSTKKMQVHRFTCLCITLWAKEFYSLPLYINSVI
jgi:hypothetical protein